MPKQIIRLVLSAFLLASCSTHQVKLPDYKSLIIRSSSQEITKNAVAQITFLLDQNETSLGKDVQCESSEPEIASVINRKIYGLSVGSASITCTYNNLVSNHLLVSVINKPLPSDEVDPTDPTGPTDPVDPTDPVEPTDPVTPTDPVITGKLLKVTYIDVGQGDSILLQTPNGKVILIDAGTNTYQGRISDELDELGIRKIDVLVATHPHADHIGGMAYIINNYEIGSVYMPKVATTTKTYETLLETIKSHGLTIKSAKAGVTIALDPALSIKIIAPISDTYADINQYSAVLRITYGSTSFLFMGDAGEVSETELLSSGVDLDSDVLKVGHHGSATSSTFNFLEAVTPDYAVICVGAGNTYGHPTDATLNRLWDIGAEILRTDQDGTVVITSDGRNIVVK